MKKWISYGNETLSFSIPDGIPCYELFPNEVVIPEDPDALILDALHQPVGCSLESLAAPGKRVCIISDDVSRPTPVSKVLSILLPYLHELGIRKDDVYFVMALGSHRHMSQEEIDDKLGAETARDYKVFQSSFADPEELLDLGCTEGDNVNITVYRRVMESDIRIGIGNIVPHNTLGWSGGSKILFPGVTSEETVSKFHTRAMLWSTGRIFGVVENDIRHSVERWAEKIGLHFIVNTILDRHSNIYRVVAGDYIKAHRKGIEYAKEVYCVPIPEKVNIVIADSHPSDCDFWQGTKGFNPTDVIIKDGGSGILISPFYEGVGPHREYPAMVGLGNVSDILSEICEKGAQSHPDLDPLAVAVGALIGRMRQRFDMYIYSDGVDDALLAEAKMHRSSDLQKTIDMLCSKYGESASIAILHFGAEIVPELENES